MRFVFTSWSDIVSTYWKQNCTYFITSCSSVNWISSYRVRVAWTEYSTSKETKTGDRSDWSLSLKTQRRTSASGGTNSDRDVWVDALRGQHQPRLDFLGVQSDRRWLKFNEHLNLEHRAESTDRLWCYSWNAICRNRNLPSGCFWRDSPADREEWPLQQNTQWLLSCPPETNKHKKTK